jgi:hypothetical protein
MAFTGIKTHGILRRFLKYILPLVKNAIKKLPLLLKIVILLHFSHFYKNGRKFSKTF